MNAVTDPESAANLPTLAATGFPVSYEEARQAIAKCESPLECRTKAQQAAAMAVYARMRDDSDLQNRAVRLQAWASRRYGELDKLLYPDRRLDNLKQGSRCVVDHNSVEPPKNANSDDQHRVGKRPAPTDGTTEYQRTISRRLASIPEDEFTRQVESLTPPTITALAEQGKTRLRVAPVATDNFDYSVETQDPSTQSRAQASDIPRQVVPVEHGELLEAIKSVYDFSQFCERVDPVRVAAGIRSHWAGSSRAEVAAITSWLDRFVASLPR